MPEAVLGWLGEAATPSGPQSNEEVTAMDEIVRAALKKWPNVPACTAGSRSTRAATGTCATHASRRRARSRTVKGSRIEHEKLREFIERNYESTDDAAVVLPERAAARLRRTRGGAARVAPEAVPARRRWCARTPGGDAARRIGVARRARPPVPCDRRRLRHRAHAGHGGRRGRHRGRPVAARDASPLRRMPARFGYVLSPASRDGAPH